MSYRASHVVLLLCALSLWAKYVLCGSSFLSPTQKPQGHGDRKQPRMGRRAEPDVPLLPVDPHIVLSTPFQVGVSLSDAEYEKYGPVLQMILMDVLDVPPLE
ncbi:appetite-regulating hormone [Brachyhypopomus gauderio]|uniref:appetite-regulating hormone n=1 Tax=Brachyhypopomus gauderio TaxID=698409 RepID=UPI0040411EB4